MKDGRVLFHLFGVAYTMVATDETHQVDVSSLSSLVTHGSILGST